MVSPLKTFVSDHRFITGKEINKIYKEILKKRRTMRPNCHIRLLDALERRLDVFCFKVGYFDTIFAARQGCKHGYISVNGRLMRKYRYTYALCISISFYWHLLLFISLQDNDFISLNFNNSNFSYQQVSENIRKRIEIFTNFHSNVKNTTKMYIVCTFLCFIYTQHYFLRIFHI